MVSQPSRGAGGSGGTAVWVLPSLVFHGVCFPTNQRKCFVLVVAAVVECSGVRELTSGAPGRADLPGAIARGHPPCAPFQGSWRRTGSRVRAHTHISEKESLHILSTSSHHRQRNQTPRQLKLCYTIQCACTTTDSQSGAFLCPISLTSDPPAEASDGALLWLALPVCMVPVDEGALEPLAIIAPP